jgi:hypothetical protein
MNSTAKQDIAPQSDLEVIAWQGRCPAIEGRVQEHHLQKGL